MSRYCVSLLGVTPGHSGDHWVSGSLVGAIRVPLHMLLTLLRAAFLGISCCLAFLECLPHPFFFVYFSFIHYLPICFSAVLPIQCDRFWGWGGVLVVEAKGFPFQLVTINFATCERLRQSVG